MPNVFLAAGSAFDIKQVKIIDIYIQEDTIYFLHQSADLTAILLTKHGFMPVSPISPALAITFKTLELFHIL